MQTICPTISARFQDQPQMTRTPGCDNLECMQGRGSPHCMWDLARKDVYMSPLMVDVCYFVGWNGIIRYVVAFGTRRRAKAKKICVACWNLLLPEQTLRVVTYPFRGPAVPGRGAGDAASRSRNPGPSPPPQVDERKKCLMTTWPDQPHLGSSTFQVGE